MEKEVREAMKRVYSLLDAMFWHLEGWKWLVGDDFEIKLKENGYKVFVWAYPQSWSSDSSFIFCNFFRDRIYDGLPDEVLVVAPHIFESSISLRLSKRHEHIEINPRDIGTPAALLIKRCVQQFLGYINRV